MALLTQLRDSEQRENHHRGSIKERRAAATKDHQRHPNSRRRRGEGGPDQSRTRSRPGSWLRALPRCHGLPHRAGSVARRRAHGLRRCWRPTPPRLRFLLLHQASGEAARGMLAPLEISTEVPRSSVLRSWAREERVGASFGVSPPPTKGARWTIRNGK